MLPNVNNEHTEKEGKNLGESSFPLYAPWNFDHPSEGVVAQRERAYQEEGGHIILFLLLCFWWLEFEPTTRT